MLTVKEAAAEFLAKRRVAVTGVSRKPQNHGGNVVYQRLRQRGYEVFAVNPNADRVEGDPCFHDLKSIPGGVDAVEVGEANVEAGNEDAGEEEREGKHGDEEAPVGDGLLDLPASDCEEDGGHAPASAPSSTILR